MEMRSLRAIRSWHARCFTLGGDVPKGTNLVPKGGRHESQSRLGRVSGDDARAGRPTRSFPPRCSPAATGAHTTKVHAATTGRTARTAGMTGAGSVVRTEGRVASTDAGTDTTTDPRLS